MSDPTIRDRIRTEAIERIARCLYERERADTGGDLPWDRQLDRYRASWRGEAAAVVAALGDLLPTDTQESLAGGFQPGIHTFADIGNQSYPPVRTVRRYVTEWTEATE